MSGPGAPFSMDTANQIAQTHGFRNLVDETRANNQRMMVAAETFQTVNQGKMAQAARAACDDCITSAVQNNEVLDGVTQGLGVTSTVTENTEVDNAAAIAHAAGGLGTSIYT